MDRGKERISTEISISQPTPRCTHVDHVLIPMLIKSNEKDNAVASLIQLSMSKVSRTEEDVLDDALVLP